MSGPCIDTVAMEIKKPNISLLGIAETGWIQLGQFRLATGELIFHTGNASDMEPHRMSRIHAIERQTKLSLAGTQSALG